MRSREADSSSGVDPAACAGTMHPCPNVESAAPSPSPLPNHDLRQKSEWESGINKERKQNPGRKSRLVHEAPPILDRSLHPQLLRLFQCFLSSFVLHSVYRSALYSSSLGFQKTGAANNENHTAECVHTAKLDSLDFCMQLQRNKEASSHSLLLRNRTIPRSSAFL